MNELALFAGAGGGILGGKLLGWRTICAVEINPYGASILLARQRDGLLPPFPIWDDVCSFDGHPWRGIVDMVSGGFPCQDISSAGKGAGITGERSGLWKQFARIIGEVQPQYVLVENSPLLTKRGLGVVLGDLAALGYDARWGVLGAVDAEAPHKRERIWIVAHSPQLFRNGSVNNTGNLPRSEAQSKLGNGIGANDVANANANVIGSTEDSGHSQLRPDRTQQPSSDSGQPDKTQPEDWINGISWWDQDPADLAHPNSNGGGGLREQVGSPEEAGQGGENSATDGNSGNNGVAGNGTRPTQSFVGRVANGVANRVDRLAAIGNGQVPAVVILAWETLRP